MPTTRLWGAPDLVGGLQFLRLHFPEDVVGGAESPHLGVAHLDIRRQTDEPQAVAVPEQALGPQLGDGGVLLGDLLSGLDLLWVKKTDLKVDALKRCRRLIVGGGAENGLTCLVRLNMGAGLVGQLCLVARREEGVCRPSTGSKRSRLRTGNPSYLENNSESRGMLGAFKGEPPGSRAS